MEFKDSNQGIKNSIKPTTLDEKVSYEETKVVKKYILHELKILYPTIEDLEHHITEYDTKDNHTEDEKQRYDDNIKRIALIKTTISSELAYYSIRGDMVKLMTDPSLVRKFANKVAKRCKL